VYEEAPFGDDHRAARHLDGVDPVAFAGGCGVEQRGPCATATSSTTACA
jgi:hypothetical protein